MVLNCAYVEWVKQNVDRSLMVSYLLRIVFNFILHSKYIALGRI